MAKLGKRLVAEEEDPVARSDQIDHPAGWPGPGEGGADQNVGVEYDPLSFHRRAGTPTPLASGRWRLPPGSWRPSRPPTGPRQFRAVVRTAPPTASRPPACRSSDTHGSLLGGPKQLAEPVLGLFGSDFSHVGIIAIMALMVKMGLRAGSLPLPLSSAARGDRVY